MPHQDQGWSASGLAIAAALNWLVTPRLFGRLSFRKDCRWTPASLAQAALLWAWGEEAALTDRFFTARQITAWLAIWRLASTARGSTRRGRGPMNGRSPRPAAARAAAVDAVGPPRRRR